MRISRRYRRRATNHLRSPPARPGRAGRPNATGAPSTAYCWMRMNEGAAVPCALSIAGLGHGYRRLSLSELPMPYVVNENCIKCKYMDCVEVCPVDCFYEG